MGGRSCSAYIVDEEDVSVEQFSFGRLPEFFDVELLAGGAFAAWVFKALWA